MSSSPRGDGVALALPAIRGHAGADGRYRAWRTACVASTVSPPGIIAWRLFGFSKLPRISLMTLYAEHELVAWRWDRWQPDHRSFVGSQ